MAYAWHPADIKAAIQKRGSTLAQVGRDAGLSSGTAKLALSRPCYVGEQAIAKFLGVPAAMIWPDRYDKDGIPRHPRIRKKLFSGSKGTNPRQNTELV